MKKPEETDTPASPSPKWLKGVHTENSKQSKKHENRLAERLGGRRYSGSGNRPASTKRYRKVLRDGRSRKDIRETEATDAGDLATPTFHFEHKFTRDQSLSVKLEWLYKVEDGAKRKLKDPGLIVTFQDNGGRVIKEYVAMPLSVYERLMRKVEAADGAD